MPRSVSAAASDARAARFRKFRVFFGQRSGLTPNLGDKSPGVDGAMDDVGGADGKRARFLQPRRLFGDEDHLGILRSGLELVLQLEKVRGIVEIKIEDAVLPELRIQAGFERPEFDLETGSPVVCEDGRGCGANLQNTQFGASPTLKNSSLTQLSKFPGQARLYKNRAQSFTLI